MSTCPKNKVSMKDSSNLNFRSPSSDELHITTYGRTLTVLFIYWAHFCVHLPFASSSCKNLTANKDSLLSSRNFVKVSMRGDRQIMTCYGKWKPNKMWQLIQKKYQRRNMTCHHLPYSKSRRQVWQTFFIFEQLWQTSVFLNLAFEPGFHRNTVKGRAHVLHSFPYFSFV